MRIKRYSIVTITKKDPEGLKKTRQSVQTQTCSDYEWIVIDGEKEADSGLYNAMNKGIERASGEYLIFMNGGDVFADEDVLRDFARYNADFIYGDAYEDKYLKKAKTSRQIKGGMITSHQAMFYRREVIGALRYDESYNIAADYKFTLQFLHKAKKTQCVDKPVCVFAEGGVSQKNAILGRQEEQAIRKEVGIVAPFTPLRQMVAHAIKRISHQLYLKIRMITQ